MDMDINRNKIDETEELAEDEIGATVSLGEDPVEDGDVSGIDFEELVAGISDDHKAIIPESVKDPLDLAKVIVKELDMKKARGLKLLHVAEKTIIADYFVLCNGSSNTQLRALCGDLEEKLGEAGIHPGHIEGYNEGSWIIMDYASVIVHIFDHETRNFYNLEKLWSDAEEIDISDLLVD